MYMQRWDIMPCSHAIIMMNVYCDYDNYVVVNILYINTEKKYRYRCISYPQANNNNKNA